MKQKWLQCIYCDHEFSLGEEFLAHMNDKKEVENFVIDACVCLECYKKEPREVQDAPAKIGGWSMLRRDLEQDYVFV